jgi:hypothetical protein
MSIPGSPHWLAQFAKKFPVWLVLAGTNERATVGMAKGEHSPVGLLTAWPELNAEGATPTDCGEVVAQGC